MNVFSTENKQESILLLSYLMSILKDGYCVSTGSDCATCKTLFIDGFTDLIREADLDKFCENLF